MELYRLIDKFNGSQDLNKDIAIKYDAGKVKSEKYGEATISGHFLLTTPKGKFPRVLVKEIEAKAGGWLSEMGQAEYQDYIINQVQLPSNIAYTIPGVPVEKLEIYFKYVFFLFLFDDGVIKINEINKDNLDQQQKDILKLAENLTLIIENHGRADATGTAVSNLDPMFKSTCVVLAHVCDYSYKHMRREDYVLFARELVNFVRVNKWRQEYNNANYSEKDYFLLRPIDGGVNAGLFLIYLTKDIHLSNEIRMHPIFQRYYINVSTHVVLTNDIFSLEKELPTDEKLNLVLIYCQKYSLQKALDKVAKTANDLVIQLKKDGIRLKSYFPNDENVKNFVESAELALDGFLYWHQSSRRYGTKIKFETSVVEYNCDYNHWLEQIGIIDVNNMKEPELSAEISVK